MISPLIGLFFKWSNKDVGAFIMFAGIILAIWFLFDIWIVGIFGVIIFILGLLLIIKPEKS
jgi:hypothetical protein